MLDGGTLNNELWGLSTTLVEVKWIAIVTAILLDAIQQKYIHKKKHFFGIILFFCPSQISTMTNFFSPNIGREFLSDAFSFDDFQQNFFLFISFECYAECSLMVVLGQTLAASWTCMEREQKKRKALEPLHPLDCYCLLRYYAQNKAFWEWVTTIM